MTLRDFKAAVLSAMKDRIEQQRHMALAVGLAIASAFDGKASKKAEKSLDSAVDGLDREHANLFLLDDFRAVNTEAGERKPPRPEDGGLGEESVEAWKTLAKIDAAFTKMTGRMTGAPWSQMTMANRDASMDKLEKSAAGITGEQIMQRVAQGARRQGRMRPGRRKSS
jgi:hypothetical protein